MIEGVLPLGAQVVVGGVHVGTGGIQFGGDYSGGGVVVRVTWWCHNIDDTAIDNGW